MYCPVDKAIPEAPLAWAAALDFWIGGFQFEVLLASCMSAYYYILASEQNPGWITEPRMDYLHAGAQT